MPFENLAEFVGKLESSGELVRVSVEVDAVFEIAEITNRISTQAGGGPALMFDNVRGSTVPVVTNLLGSESRICRALGADNLDDVAERIAHALQPDLPSGWLERLRFVPQLSKLTSFAPKSITTGTCQQVVRVGSDVNLLDLPIPHSWPAEPAAAITAGELVVVDPETGLRHAGIYPLEVRGHNSLRVHWTPHDRARDVYQAYMDRNQQMPVVIALGGPPADRWCAMTPLPDQTDAWLLSGFFRQTSLNVVKCRSIDADAPAEAEFVVEGYIDTGASPEAGGPVAASTGFYGETWETPVIHVTAITHRSNPMLPAAITGTSSSEESCMRRSLARVLLPFIRLFIPEIADVHLPAAGGSHGFVFAGIRKRFPNQARKVMNAIWSLGPLMTSKLVVVVDDSVNVRDENAVWSAVNCAAHPGRDVVFSEGPADMADHAAPVRGMGHRMGIDATRKLPEEGHTRPWPDELQSSDEIRTRVESRWAEYGLDRVLHDNSRAARRAADDGG